MIVNYTYRIYPSETQKEQILRYMGNERWIWNKLLSLNIKRSENGQDLLTYPEMCNKLPLLKSQCEWLKSSPSQSLQQVIRELDFALKNSIRNNIQFPQPKCKKDHCRLTIPGINFFDKKIHVPKIGLVKYKKHRELPKDIKSTWIIYKGNRFFIVVRGNITPRVSKRNITKNQTIGISLGHNFIITDSTGKKVSLPNTIIKKEKSKIRKQRMLRKKQKSSRNYTKLIKDINSLNNKIIDSKRDFFHKLALFLLYQYDMICIENSPKTKEGKFFEDILKQKCEKYGKKLIKVQRHDPAYKTCCVCHKKHIINNICQDCGLEMDTTHNAAMNVLDWGYKQYRRGYGNLRFSDTKK